MDLFMCSYEMDYIEDTFFYEEEPAHWVALSSRLALLAPRVRCSPLGSLCSPHPPGELAVSAFAQELPRNSCVH